LNAFDALSEDAASCSGKAYFISQGEPVCLWSWLNQVLEGLGQPPLLKRIPLGVAYSVGAIAEVIWKLLAKAGEPPITRFVAVELAKDHYFRIDEATRDIGYRPSVEMDDALKNTIRDLSERGY
jgi:nucleoside-diphosphate-sugar epimerase